MAKKQAEYASCPICKTRFRKKRTLQIYCCRACNEKARRERACSGVCSFPVPPHPQHENTAGNGANTPQKATQTDKKCLHTEGENPRYESLLVRGPNGRKWGRNPNQITAEMLEAEGIKKTPLLAVMRAMCLDCRPPEEVLVCARPTVRCGRTETAHHLGSAASEPAEVTARNLCLRCK